MIPRSLRVLHPVSGQPSRIAAWLLSAGLLLATPAVAEVVLHDGTFAPDDWEMTIFWEEGLGGEIFSYQEGSGGNPGEFRAIDITLNPEPGRERYNRISSFHGYLPQLYNPVQDGPIYSFDYHEESRLIEGYDQGQGGGPALRQDGLVYIGPAFVLPEFYWVPRDLPTLTAGDFYLPDDPNHHPDFSATGTPVEFGFWRGNSAWSNDYYHSLGGIDNWTVTINNDIPIATEAGSWGRIKALFKE